MIGAIDIETIPNPEMVDKLPPPKVDSRLKDPAKIAAAESTAKAKQVEKMGLDPMYARVLCWSMVGSVGTSGHGPEDEAQEHAEIIPAMTDEAERAILQSAFNVLGQDDARLITWNGNGFDLPFVYKRALVLGINPADFGAPPLAAWTKRYNTDRHYDLMQIWGGWSSQGMEKLDVVARAVLGEEKQDMDFKLFPVLMLTPEGRAKITEYCLQDSRLTWRLWNRFKGVLFA